MIARILGLTLATTTAAILFYLSRFWEFRLWQGNLWGIDGLRAQGDLTARWLRGTDFAPFSLLLWFLGAILVLTVLQWIWNALSPKNDP